MTNARLVAYEPNGPYIGILPPALDWSWSAPRNDTPALTAKWSRAVLNDDAVLSRRLGQGLEVAVEVHNGSDYLEPDNARCLLWKRASDQADPFRNADLTLPGYGSVLSKMRLVDPAHVLPDDDPTNAGKRPFLSATPGAIMATVLQEYQQIDGGPALARTFTSTHDSLGRPWANVTTLYFDDLTPADVMLQTLVQMGACEYTFRGRSLVLTNPDGLTADREGTVILHVGRDVGESPTDESIEEFTSKMYFRGGGGIRLSENNVSAETPWGPFIGADSNESVTVAGTARSIMQQELRRVSRVRAQYTRDLLEGAHFRPYRDFRVADWVTAPTTTGRERVRVEGIMLRNDGKQTIGALTLNDRFMDAELRRLKRQRGVVGGASGGGGSPVRPAPPGQDKRTPAKVQGLVGSTWAYLIQDQARSVVRLAWGAVSTATDGTAMEIASYDVQTRENVTGAPWVGSGASGGSSTTVDIHQLMPGQVRQWRVRARGRYATDPGVWSDTFTLTNAPYVEPPPTPSAPVLTTKLGVITVRWDGLTETGTQMPGSFRRVEVAMTSNAVTTPPDAAIIDTLPAKGSRPVTDQAPGQQRYFWFRAVGIGGRSGWSDRANIATELLVDRDAIDKSITDAIDNSTQRIDHLNNNVIPGINQRVTTADGRLTADTRAPVVADGAGKPVNAIWNQYDGNRLIGSWLWTGSAWSPRQPQTVHIDTGTFGELDGIRLRAATVLANALAITPANLFPDPYINEGQAAWGGQGIFTDAAMPGNRRVNLDGGTAMTGFYLRGTGARYVPIEAGASYRVSFTARAGGTAPPDTMRLYLRYDTTSGSAVSTFSTVDLRAARLNYRRVSTDITIPADASPGTLAAVGFFTAAPYSPNGVVFIGGVEMTRKVGSVLIEDGAVTAPKITVTEEFTAKVAQFLKAKVDQLDVNEIWGNTAWLGLARVNVLQVGGIPANRLAFGTDNLAPNQMWGDVELRERWPAAAAGWSYNTGNSNVNWQGQSHVLFINGSQAANNSTMDISGWFPAPPGEKFRLEMTGYRTSGNFTVRLRLVVRLESGGQNIQDISLPVTTASSTRRTVSGVLTAPDGAVEARLQMQVTGSPTTSAWYINSVSAHRAMSSQTATGQGSEIHAGGQRFWNDQGRTWFEVNTDNQELNLSNGTFVARRNDNENYIGMFPPAPTGSGGSPNPRLELSGGGFLSPATLEVGSGGNGLTVLQSGTTTGNPSSAYRLAMTQGSINLGPAASGLTDHGLNGNADSYRLAARNSVVMETLGSGNSEIELRPYRNHFQSRIFVGAGWDDNGGYARVWGRSGSGNLTITADETGRIYRAQSLEELKVDIDRDAVIDVDALRQLRPTTYRDKGQVERGEQAHVQMGLIAQDVDKIAGLEPIVQRGTHTGNLAGVAYDRLAVALLAWLHEHDTSVTDLTARIEALEDK